MSGINTRRCCCEECNWGGNYPTWTYLDDLKDFITITNEPNLQRIKFGPISEYACGGTGTLGGTIYIHLASDIPAKSNCQLKLDHTANLPVVDPVEAYHQENCSGTDDYRDICFYRHSYDPVVLLSRSFCVLGQWEPTPRCTMRLGGSAIYITSTLLGLGANSAYLGITLNSQIQNWRSNFYAQFDLSWEPV